MKKKIILAITLLIIIIGAIFFVTRSAKQEFISYIIKDDIWNVLEESKVEKYKEKQENVPYTNKGQISITTNGLKELSLGMIQDIKWLFEGKTNKSETKLEQDILIDTAEKSVIKFKKDNETIGILTELLGSKFVAIENKDLKRLAEKFGFSSETIPNKIEVVNNEFSSSEVKEIGNKYLKIFNKKIQSYQFSKEEIENEKVISLNITEEQAIEIIKNVLKEIRDDETILNYITEDMKLEMQGKIDNTITEMDLIEINPNNKIIIKLYIKSNDIQKYEIIFVNQENETSKTTIKNTDKEISITTYQDDELLLEGNLSKNTEEKDVNYNFSIKVYIEGQKTELSLNAQYKNIAELKNIEEIFNIKISYEDLNKYGNLKNTSNLMEINLNYLNQKNFEENLEIEGLNGENAIILNTATDEDLQSIKDSIYKNLDIF